MEPKKVDRRDGSTGGGNKPVFAVANAEADKREPFVQASLNEGKGYRVRTSPKSGWRIIELDIQADPRKTEEWAKQMRATIGEQRFQREYLRNWSLSTQLPYYPEFQANGGRETFVRKITSIGRQPLLMGLDFGVRRPALVVAQGNVKKTRLWWLREWSPVGITSVPFLEVCEWLMGELPKRALGPQALVHVLELERAAEEGRGPAVPWFVDPPQVLRYTSQEALRTSQEVSGESRERRIVDIWEARGFPLNVHFAQVKGGGDVLRHLFRAPEKDRLPYSIADPACKLLIEGWEGGYTFKRGTRENPMPEEPTKDGKYEHTQDCAKYIASNAIDMKAIDDGKDEETKTLPTPRAVTKKEPKDWYSRAEKEDTGEGFSSPFDVGRSRPDWDEREEY